MSNFDLPKCYILRLKDHPMYAPHTNFAFALYENLILQFLKDNSKSYGLTDNIDQAKRWATHKKLRVALRQYPEAAKYYYVVGSDGSVVDAVDVLK